MTPYDIAKAMYESKGWDFQKDFEAFSRGGYVLSTPRYFIFADLKPDHWYIHICVGHGASNFFVSIMPEYRPQIAFARGLRNGTVSYTHLTLPTTPYV